MVVFGDFGLEVTVNFAGSGCSMDTQRCPWTDKGLP
jgi:hypothetical protein